MEMAEGKYTKRTSLDPTSPPVTETAEEALDVVIVECKCHCHQGGLDGPFYRRAVYS